MTVREITAEEKQEYNNKVHHPLQSYEWGEFRRKTGLKVIRKGFFEGQKLIDGFQLTIHKIPHTPFTIGYLPKGKIPNKILLEELMEIGKKERCIFIQLEPGIKKTQVEKNWKLEIGNWKLLEDAHPLFTRYNFILDITSSEEELLKNMHPKTRYNIKVSQKYGVKIIEDNSEKAFEKYWELILETTQRQKFFAHTKQYHTTQRQVLNVLTNKDNDLTAHLFLAKYNHEILTTWTLFIFHDTLYYPYGASSSKHREVMASNLMMWEAIRFGKAKKLKQFDMWGSLEENPNKNDPWYGFHRFKQGYGPELVEYVGSFDLVINSLLYQFYKVADKARWAMLKLRK